MHGPVNEYGSAPPSGGAFRSFLTDQRLLQRTAFQRDPAALSGEELVEFVRWNTLAAVVELGEMLEPVRGWKPWDTKHRGDAAGINDSEAREKFVDEGVDVLHFIANLLLTAGVTDAELSEAFKRKQDKNRARQESGYDGRGAAWDQANQETA